MIFEWRRGGWCSIEYRERRHADADADADGGAEGASRRLHHMSMIWDEQPKTDSMRTHLLSEIISRNQVPLKEVSSSSLLLIGPSSGGDGRLPPVLALKPYLSSGTSQFWSLFLRDGKKVPVSTWQPEGRAEYRVLVPLCVGPSAAHQRGRDDGGTSTDVLCGRPSSCSARILYDIEGIYNAACIY